ncbi:MAG: alginate lyase family protein [Burkholderiales bacterium]|nr:alginate lyase family protein [Opitutaceae bacterium]
MSSDRLFNRRAFIATVGGGLALALMPHAGRAEASAFPSEPITGAERKRLEAELASLLSEPATLDTFHARVTSRLRAERVGGSATEHARQWAALYPAPARALVKTAENDALGRLVLPGTGNALFDVGTPPRWHANPVKDAEFVWFLNRHYSWPRLLRAGAITGNPSFAARMVAELDDWMEACPCPPIGTDDPTVQSGFNTVSPWRALEVGLRMYTSWPVTLRLLADSPLLTPERLARFTIVAHQHGRVLATVSPVLWPEAEHNHYLMENVGLLVLTGLLPELRVSAEWRQHAWRELNRCLDAQLTPDGAQVEGAPHYHNVTVGNFCDALMIGERERLPGADAFRRRVEGMLDYALHSFRPSGTTVPWADGDATPKGLESAMWGALALGDTDRLAVARTLVAPATLEETAGTFAWRIDDLAGWPAMLTRPAARVFPRLHADRALDQVMARTDWSPRALSVFFGCHTPITPPGNGHAHIDPATFDFTAYGRPLAVDPGRFTYRQDEDRRNFKSAKWHNSLTIDDREPFEYLSGWKFGPQREGRIVRVYDAPGLLGAEAVNHNFAPAVHRRAVVLLNDSALLVLDEVVDLPAGSRVQLWFHLDSAEVVWDAAMLTARSTDEGRANVCVIATPGLDGELLEGRVSDAMDVARPSRRLKLSSAARSGRCAFATLLVPFAAGEKPPAPGLPIEIVSDGGDAWRVRLPLGNKPVVVDWKPGAALDLISL